MRPLIVQRKDSRFYHHICIIEQVWDDTIEASIDSIVAEGVFMLKRSADMWMEDSIFQYLLDNEMIIKTES